jgi:exodeoxyribonuclease VIII
MQKKYENGLHNDISNHDYHASQGVSKSGLLIYQQCPEKYHYQYLSGQYEKKVTDALALGNLFHTLTLEPHKFEKDYYVISQKTIPKKGTKPYLDMLEKAEGRECCTSAQLEVATEMAASVHRNKLASDLLRDAQIEHSIYYQVDKDGPQLKCRPDAIKEALSGTIAIDLKSVRSAQVDDMQRDVYNLGYALQAAMIRDGLASIDQEMTRFVYIATEKEPPYCTAVRELGEHFIDFGEEEFTNIYEDYKESLKNNNWPGYSFATIELPAWARSKSGV